MKIRPILLIVFAGVAGLIILVWSTRELSLSEQFGPDVTGPADASKLQSQANRQTASRSTSTLASAVENSPALVRPILGLDGHTNFWDRLQAIHALSSDLKADEVQALYAFLRTKKPSDVVLKNDLLNVLLNQNQPPVALGQVLLDIYHDPEQDLVTRDYSLQHLVSWYEKMYGMPLEASLIDSEQKEAVQQAFWEGVSQTDSSIAGTALLGLKLLSQSQPDFDGSRIAAAALRLTREGNSSELARITALQICGQMEINEALPLALELAQKAESIPLRISAIAALGNLGGEEHINLLARLDNDENQRLVPAVQSALCRLKQRIKGH